MDNRKKFFIYLLENYAAYKNTTAEIILKEWEKKGILQYIDDMYERYHQEAIENAYDDIDKICIK